jgi:DNA repair protein RadC
MTDESSYLPVRKILSWAEEDRPREKLELRGKESLTDAELIAILINSGTPDLSAVDVGKLIMSYAENNIGNLARLSIKDLTKIKGIGKAKAITIIAALELGRRRKDSDLVKNRSITSSGDVYQEMMPVLMDKVVEEFWVLLLNRANVVIRKVQISKGGISGTVVDPKIVFKSALEYLASSIILVHNHPSGTLKPSKEDIHITGQLKEAGKVLDIPVLDHLIFTDNGYVSFADDGLL